MTNNTPITIAYDRRLADLRATTFVMPDRAPRPSTKSGRPRTTRRRKTIR